MKIFKIILVIAFMTLITACTTIPLSTMYKMRNFSPLTVDPQQLLVAVRVPAGMKVRDGDIVIDFGFKTPKPEANFKHQFLVQVNPDYPIPEKLKEDIQDNEHISVLQRSKEDALKMIQAQQAVKAYRENHDDGTGSFGLKIESACRDEGFSQKNALLNIYIKLKDDEDFFVFIQDMDLTTLDNGDQDAFDKIPHCD